MRKTSERRTQISRGKAAPGRPDAKNRLSDETFGVLEDVEAPDDEVMIPERVAQRKGYVTLAQMARVMSCPPRFLYYSSHNYWRSVRRPKPVGRLQNDKPSGGSPFLYRRDELLTWVRASPELRKKLPPELR